MIQELRFGTRMLWKQPAFTLIAVLTLALGIGATSAVFGLIQGVLLAPPPYERPQQLFLIHSSRPEGHPHANPPAWAAAQWTEWQKQSKSFDSFAGYGWTFNFLVRSDGSESMEGMVVTRDYFRVMGLKPLLGRVFLDSETEYPAAPVIILGYDLWQRKFNGDPHILGKTVRMSRRTVAPTVVAVMPPGVRFLPSPGAAQEPNYNVNATVDFWLPDAPNPKGLRDPAWDVVGRLKPGITPRQGEEDLRLITARQAQAESDLAGFRPQLESLTAAMNRDGRRILLPLLGAAGLVLLIACGNVGALLLVRGFQRQQEYAVRSALGVILRRSSARYRRRVCCWRSWAGFWAWALDAAWSGCSRESACTPSRAWTLSQSDGRFWPVDLARRSWRRPRPASFPPCELRAWIRFRH